MVIDFTDVLFGPIAPRLGFGGLGFVKVAICAKQSSSMGQVADTANGSKVRILLLSYPRGEGLPS